MITSLPFITNSTLPVRRDRLNPHRLACWRAWLPDPAIGEALGPSTLYQPCHHQLFSCYFCPGAMYQATHTTQNTTEALPSRLQHAGGHPTSPHCPGGISAEVGLRMWEGLSEEKAEQGSRKEVLGGNGPQGSSTTSLETQTRDKALLGKRGTQWMCSKAPEFVRDRTGPPNTGKCFRQFLSLHYQ